MLPYIAAALEVLTPETEEGVKKMFRGVERDSVDRKCKTEGFTIVKSNFSYDKKLVFGNKLKLFSWSFCLGFKTLTSHRRENSTILTAPLNNVRTLKFKAQSTNAFSLLSIKCSLAPPNFRLCCLTGALFSLP